MGDITIEELDLLGFFAAEPTRLDPDVPWPYNDFLYAAERGGLSLSFALAPAYKDVRIIITLGTATVYELSAMGVDDVKYHKDGLLETLEIVVTPSDRLVLSIWPSIKIDHRSIDES